MLRLSIFICFCLLFSCKHNRTESNHKMLSYEYAPIKEQLANLCQFDSCVWLSQTLSSERLGPTTIRVSIIGYLSNDNYESLTSNYSWSSVNSVELPNEIRSKIKPILALYSSDNYNEYLIFGSGYIGNAYIDSVGKRLIIDIQR